MALPAHAQRALDTLKMNALILYGAGHFDETAWFQMDKLIHRGKYVFTNGPPSKEPVQPLLEHKETLVIRTEPYNIAQKEVALPTVEDTSATSATSVESALSSLYLASEKLISESPAPSLISPLTDPYVAVPACTSSSLTPVPEFDMSVCNSSHTQPQASVPKAAFLGGNVEDQLENSRAEEGSLSTSREDARISSWASDVDAAELEQQNLAALASSKDETISVSDKTVYSSASLDATNRKFINLHHQAPKYLNDISQPRNADYSGPKPRKSKLSIPAIVPRSPGKKVEQFTENGYLTALEIGKSYTAAQAQKGTEIIRPNKPALPGIKLDVAQGDEVKILKSVSGLIYHATNARTRVAGQVSAGMFLKSESADETAAQILHTKANEKKATTERPAAEEVNTENLTRDNSVANEVVFETRAGDQPQTQQSVKTSSLPQHKGLPEWGSFEAIDVIETLNAAEWEKDDDELASVPAEVSDNAQSSGQSKGEPERFQPNDTSSQWSDVPIRQKQQNDYSAERPWQSVSAQKRGLASLAGARSNPTLITPSTSSRFALLDDDAQNEPNPKTLEADRYLSIRTPAAPRKYASLKEVLKDMVPKKYTCWYWHINQECRFTDKECVHRHWVVPGEPVEYDLHKGRPRWGAAADYDSIPSSPSVAVEASNGNPDEVCKCSHNDPAAGIASEKVDGSKEFTCFFWATKGSCTFPDDICRYSHRHMPAGIAPAKDLKRLTCFYWASEGSCTFDNDTCKYSHKIMPAGNAPPPGGKWAPNQYRKAWDGTPSSWRKEEKEEEESCPSAGGTSKEWGNTDFTKPWEEGDGSTSTPAGNSDSAHAWGNGTPAHILQQEVGW